jgi:Leucine-rich repeat (LRR) protein
MLHPIYVSVCSFATCFVALAVILPRVVLPVAAECDCEGALPALQALYDATDGARWVNPWNNLSSTSVCRLSGVNCSNGKLQLNLNFRNLIGTLPDDLAALYPFVETFEVASNQVRGTLPSAFGLYGEFLTKFDVSSNVLLTGTLPLELKNWTRMSTFIINNCSFTGTLPAVYATWGNSLLTFRFYINSLEGTIPAEYSAWKTLRMFYGSKNNISGQIPPQVISSWKYTVNDFSMGYNRLTGDLFASNGNGFCEWSVLTNFVVYSNRLFGSIPSCLSNWGSTIDQFSIGNNSFTGTLPGSLQSWTLVRNVDIGGNLIEGTLPAVYSLMKNIETLNAGRNQLTGTLPPQYGAWSALVRVLFSTNQLTGSLPEAYSGWSASIFDIRISQNNLSGTLPESWAAFSKLQRMLLAFNQLTGTLPESYSGMKSLVLLSLDVNQFHGSLPRSWNALTALQVIGLQQNPLLEGPIPPAWSSMIALLVFAICNTSVCGNASMFLLVGVFGFSCPAPSILASIDPENLQQYFIQSPKFASFPCIPTPAPATKPGVPPLHSNATTVVLPYTALAEASGTVAVWSVVAARGLPISGSSPPAASVAFLQGAFASSRFRRHCSAVTDDDPANDANDPPPLSNPMDNPTQLELSQKAGRYAGGAVIGNSALLTGATIIGHAATLLKLRLRKRAPHASGQAGRCIVALLPCEDLFPASGFMLYSLLIQPSIVACVVLASHSGGAADAFVIVVVGVVIWLAPLMVFAWKLFRMRLPFTTIRAKKENLISEKEARKTEHQTVAPPAHKAIPRRATLVTVEAQADDITAQQESHTELSAKDRLYVQWTDLLHFFWSPTHSWRSTHDGASDKSAQRVFYRSYGVLFAGVRVEWKMLFAVELGLAAVSGVVQGAAEVAGISGNADEVCDAAVWGSATLAVLAAAVLVLHVVWKPCLVRFDELQCIVLTSLVVASECANAIGGDAGEQVGELLAVTGAIMQAVLALLEVIVTRVFTGASALQAASPFRYLETVLSNAARIAAASTAPVRQVLNVPTITLSQSGSQPSAPNETISSRHGDDAGLHRQDRQNAFVTLHQMKELKNLLRQIARQKQSTEWRET